MRAINRWLLRFAMPLGAAVFGDSARAAAQAVPTAEQLIARHEAAIGGRAAIDRHASLRMTGRIEIAAQDVRGTIEILRAKPDLFVKTTTLDSAGAIVRGFDGTTAWVIEFGRPGLLTGDDAVLLESEASWYHAFGAPAALRSARVDSTDFEDEPAWRVTYARELGVEVSTYFSQLTGLRLGEMSPVAAGTQTFVQTDYHEFGAVKVPTRLITRSSVGSVVTIIESVEFDRVAPSAFALPPAIKALKR